jgi:hypothetical protein
MTDRFFEPVEEKVTKTIIWPYDPTNDRIDAIAREMSKIDSPNGEDQFELLSADMQNRYRSYAAVAMATLGWMAGDEIAARDDEVEI